MPKQLTSAALRSRSRTNDAAAGDAQPAGEVDGTVRGETYSTAETAEQQTTTTKTSTTKSKE